MPSWKKVIVSGSDAFLNALTVTNGITGSLHGTASWAQNAITASYVLNAVSASFANTASYVSSNFQYEVHVSQVDGNDTTGNGSLLNPVASITKALQIVSASVAVTDRRTVIIHPGTYTENPTISTTNTYIFALGLLGANTAIAGTVTINAACRFAGIKMTNLVVNTTSPVYIANSTVDTQMTVTNTGYLETTGCSFQCTSGVTVSGAAPGVVFNSTTLWGLVVNNASAIVVVRNSPQVYVATVLAGNLSLSNTLLFSATPTGNAITTSAGSVVTLSNLNILDNTALAVARVSLSGFYSIIDVVYDKPNSTLVALSGTGGPLNAIDYFQYINADNVNTKGLIVTGSINVSGSVINTLTASFAVSASQVTSASFATTSSYALNAVTASFITASNVYGPFGSNSVISSSFALTASFALNGGGSTNTGSLLTTGSVAGNVLTFTKGDNTTFNLTVATGSGGGSTNTGSLLTTGSVSGNVLTFTKGDATTFNLTVATGSGGGGGSTVTHTQLTASTTWSFTHNLNTQTPLLQVYDLGYEQIIPNEIASINAFTSEIRFTYSQSGYAVASTGGGLSITGSTSRLVQTVAATTWSFAHNLGTKYPGFEIFNSSDDVIIPAGIHVVDTNNAEIYFALPSTGVAIANFSGIDGVIPVATSASYAATASLALTAISSSYAATASYSDAFNIGQTQTRYATVTSSINGSNTVFTQATGSYSSAFFKYTVTSGSNARSGEIMSVWNGATTAFTDNSTTDIGTTTAVTSSVALSGANVQLNVQTNTAGWRIKSIATFM
jgi:hypothetical protein